jgi:hypothetical protein
MCVASKLAFGPDIRLLMVRAVADVNVESAVLVHCRETSVTDSGGMESWIRLIATMNLCASGVVT